MRSAINIKLEELIADFIVSTILLNLLKRAMRKCPMMNPNGIANRFMAINMAHPGGNININEMMEDDNKEEQWKCGCGSINTTRYCPNCGREKPGSIICPSCGYNLPGKLNNAKFCPNCGAPLKK